MSYQSEKERRGNEKFQDIMKEVKMLQALKHPQVVQLISTFLKEKEHSVWIVMEYCLGSVSDCVEVQLRVYAPFYWNFIEHYPVIFREVLPHYSQSY